jgi:hypothetical protein
MARAAQCSASEVTMGRAFEVIRTRPLETLFGYFGVDAEPQLVSAHRDAIAQRFLAEVRELARVCARLREKERFTLLREALRLAYDGAVLRASAREATGA